MAACVACRGTGSSDVFARIHLGDQVVWEREARYGGSVYLTVVGVTRARFTAIGGGPNHNWRFTFRRRDGRRVGSRSHIFWVKPLPFGGPTYGNKVKL